MKYRRIADYIRVGSNFSRRNYDNTTFTVNTASDIRLNTYLFRRGLRK